jgi:quercetin dioxygenase-like cupin family protein
LLISNALPFNPEALGLFGLTIQFVIGPKEDNVYCMLKGGISPGLVVPIHSHADHETFYIISGALQGLKGDRWDTFGSGDVFDVRGGTKHAFRNVSSKSASVLIVTTSRLGRFFLKIARPLAAVPPGPPPDEELQRIVEASLMEGHWLGSVEDNAKIGITCSLSTDGGM